MVPPQTVDLKLHPIAAELKLINPQADWLLSTISTKMISGLYEFFLHVVGSLWFYRLTLRQLTVS